MIGNKKGLGVLGILFLIIFLIIALFASFWIIEEVRYSWKNKQEINNNDATCYLERGVFKFPYARICTYNNTFIVEKTRLGPNLIQKVKQLPQEFR
tara:strand:- start:739 stop:1026 length:288 start_codon:yes stop_codon:yes gene_type:complete